QCGPVVDIGLPQPLPQRHRMHPKISGDLLDRHPVFAVAGDPDKVVAKLLGIGPCHGDILPARHPGQAISGVTYSCSRPVGHSSPVAWLGGSLVLGYDHCGGPCEHSQCTACRRAALLVDLAAEHGMSPADSLD